MDKWKPSELEKMKVGGNKKLNEFLEEHDDFNEQWTIGTVSFLIFRQKIQKLIYVCLFINESKMKNIILKVLHCTEIKYLPKLKEMWVILWSLFFLSEIKVWDEASSPAQNYVVHKKEPIVGSSNYDAVSSSYK